MHSDMLTGSALLLSSLNTACGQTLTHVPSPSHLFLSIVTMIMANAPPEREMLPRSRVGRAGRGPGRTGPPGAETAPERWSDYTQPVGFGRPAILQACLA